MDYIFNICSNFCQIQVCLTTIITVVVWVILTEIRSSLHSQVLAAKQQDITSNFYVSILLFAGE